MRRPGWTASCGVHASTLVVLACFGMARADTALGKQRPVAAAHGGAAKKSKPRARQALPPFIRKAQARDATVPFWLRLRRPSDSGPSDDRLQLTWDDAAQAWPVPGTVPEPTVTTPLEGALTYELDFGAETGGYGPPGTVETRVGGATALTGGGFAIAAWPDTTTPACTGPRLVATGISLVSAGLRFGKVNLFQGTASGTVSVRAAVRTERRTCDGQVDGASMVTTVSASDPPVPIPFDGRFKISPAITRDGSVRFGVLTVDGAATRSAFARLFACADPTAGDGCGRVGLPMRVRWSSLNAEVMLGQTALLAPPGP